MDLQEFEFELSTSGVDVAALLAAGRSVAPAFAEFGAWVRTNMAEQQLERVYLLSREGPFLSRVLRSAGIDGEQLIQLDVSRVSTLLPAMETFEPESLMRLWERFPRQTPEELLRALSLDVETLREPLDRHDLALHDRIHRPWMDPRMQSFLRDPEVQSHATERRNEARSLVDRYLTQQGLDDADAAGFVDVGWRGTIQDSIAVLRPQTQTIGLLLAHRPAGVAQPENAAKYGFVAGMDSEGERFGQEIRLAASPLEMLTTAPGGTTVGYERIGDRVEPVRRPIQHEETVLEQEIAAFQQGVLAAIEELGPSSRPDVARGRASQSLKSVLFDPPPELVDAFHRYHLDQSVGGGRKRRRGWRVAGSAIRQPQLVKDLIQDHGWPHALMKRLLGSRLYGLVRRSAANVGGMGRWVA